MERRTRNATYWLLLLYLSLSVIKESFEYFFHFSIFPGAASGLPTTNDVINVLRQSGTVSDSGLL